MREILFKGKRIDNGEWVYGYIVKHGECWWIYLGERYIAEEYIEEFKLTFNHSVKFEVDPETVCQYTGLTDKNGNKIFEGDILKLTDKVNGGDCIVYVEFGNQNGEYNWGFQLVRVHGDNLNTDILLWVDMEEAGAYAEIVGNVFDNQELLGDIK